MEEESLDVPYRWKRWSVEPGTVQPNWADAQEERKEGSAYTTNIITKSGEGDFDMLLILLSPKKLPVCTMRYFLKRGGFSVLQDRHQSSSEAARNGSVQMCTLNSMCQLIFSSPVY